MLNKSVIAFLISLLTSIMMGFGQQREQKIYSLGEVLFGSLSFNTDTLDTKQFFCDDCEPMFEYLLSTSLKKQMTITYRKGRDVQSQREKPPLYYDFFYTNRNAAKMAYDAYVTNLKKPISGKTIRATLSEIIVLISDLKVVRLIRIDGCKDKKAINDVTHYLTKDNRVIHFAGVKCIIKHDFFIGK
ncbi:hypothetical protein QNI16_33880 [Cytophagaceae bacterium YF14B1]|uniref:Uncharacterized protein n=1 Tax=Xanthocytophaga flava TaxID=3048013 RepID=A0AAE3QYJ4_9BACT|nr:hypothetical protein [Xanthocytophaga flavus]MDJ1485530.1 hypothetical protein [Xanthocytophaga flavus]